MFKQNGNSRKMSIKGIGAEITKQGCCTVTEKGGRVNEKWNVSREREREIEGAGWVH